MRGSPIESISVDGAVGADYPGDAPVVPGRRRTPPAAAAIRLVPSVLPGLLMAVIALIGAGRPVLSWDEVATVDIAGRTPGQIWELIHNVDAVFGPYYFFMHFWTGLIGDTEIELRLPSIIAMAAAVALAGELARRLFSPSAGLLTGLILCLLPNLSRYAAEARPYAFACFFSVLALLLLYRALERPGKLRWTTYALAVVLLGFSHVIALTTLCAHATAVCVTARSSRSWRLVIGWAAAAGTALLVLLPLLLLARGQQAAQVAWVAPLTWELVRAAPADLTGSEQAGWLLAGLALMAAGRRPRRHLAAIATMAIGPILVVAAVSVLISPLWVPRYLLVVLTPMAMLAAVAIVGPRDRATRPATAAPPGNGPAVAPTATAAAPPVAVGLPGGNPVAYVSRSPTVAAAEDASRGHVVPARSENAEGRDPAAAVGANVGGASGDPVAPVLSDRVGVPGRAAPGTPDALGDAAPGVSFRPPPGASAVGRGVGVDGGGAAWPSASPIGVTGAGRGVDGYRPGLPRGAAVAHRPSGFEAEAGPDDPTVRLDVPATGPRRLPAWRRCLPAWRLVVRVAVVLALLGFAAYPGQRSVRAVGAKNGADFQSIASIIRHGQQPGDGLVIAANARSLTAGTNYYLRHDPGRPPNLLTERTAAAAAQLAPIDYPDAAAHVQGTRRVWLLVGGRHNDPTWARTDLQPLLRTKYERIGLWHLKWSTLALYTLRPPKPAAAGG